MSNKNKNLLDIFLESAIGFDYLEKPWMSGDAFKQASAYLPYNISATKKGYSIEMAVAGYGAEDISVEVKGGSLSIKGKKPVGSDKGKEELLYKGLGLRNFQKYFSIVTGVIVKSATVKDGILKIELEREEAFTSMIPVWKG